MKKSKLFLYLFYILFNVGLCTICFCIVVNNYMIFPKLVSVVLLFIGDILWFISCIKLLDLIKENIKLKKELNKDDKRQ